ncbi:hypothetical protein L3C95_19930 [Chitinophaga filiformis]|uniref:hypothetical protein n=1 Tax=Chitinophaga filiformis TaxID=104663 RepID=UPI001F372527|nr:hypothetical protein [Chitinophaga filiformis]MCF6405183.1 hypothetical protein [Chitinophaga filiformis]
MPKKRTLKISIISSLLAICIAAASWWLYLTYTYVEFAPLAFDKQKGYVPSQTANGFYKNLGIVLKSQHIDHKLNILDHPLIPLRIANDKALMCDLTAKAQDVVWMYKHMDEKLPSFLCEGKNYQGFVFHKEAAYGHTVDYGDIVDIELGCKDIELAERIMQVHVEQVMKLRKVYSDVDLSLYYRQYFGYQRDNGDRIVYVDLVRKDIPTVSGLLNGIIRIEQGHKANLISKVNLTQRNVETFEATLIDYDER